MQFKIPQDVQIEDKIIAFITMRQLIILGIGGAITYAIYMALAKEYVWTAWGPPVVITGGLTTAIAFLKIGAQQIPFVNFILYYAAYNIRSRKRIWQKMQGDVLISAFKTTKPTKTDKKIDEKKEKDQKKFKELSELTKALDTHSQFFKEKEEKSEKLNEFLESKGKN